MGNFEVRADAVKNRLYICSEGFLTVEENEEATTRILEALNKLKPGFDMISDLAKMKAATQEGSQQFTRAYDAIKARGRNRNVVVIEDSIARMQIERTSRSTGIKAEFAASVEEAERMLDSVK